MLWQYRTNLFEFTKDGLLGDKYVDDEEMEKTLNQLGKKSWELVSVSLLQDGLLVFLKRPMQEEVFEEQPAEAEPEAPPVITQRTSFFSRNAVAAKPVPEEEPELEPVRNPEPPQKITPQKQEMDCIGDIRIS